MLASYIRFFICLGLAVLCLSPAYADNSRPAFLKGSMLESVSAASALPQWNRVLEQYVASEQIYQDCYDAPFTCPTRGMEMWQRFVRSIKDDPAHRQIEMVNTWFNKLPYKQDDWVYGERDYWASMDEFLEHSGDCEDFAMAKYLTLRQLGIPAKEMWVATAYDVYSGTDHAFLIVDYDGETMVLDNRKVTVEAKEHSRRYRPHYLFNELNVWTYDEPVMARTIRKDQEDILPGNR